MQTIQLTEGYDKPDDALQRAIGERMLAAAARPNRVIGEYHEDQTKRLMLTAMWKEGYWQGEN